MPFVQVVYINTDKAESEFSRDGFEFRALLVFRWIWLNCAGVFDGSLVWESVYLKSCVLYKFYLCIRFYFLISRICIFLI